jgi:hypothetical protein
MIKRQTVLQQVGRRALLVDFGQRTSRGWPQRPVVRVCRSAICELAFDWQANAAQSAAAAFRKSLSNGQIVTRFAVCAKRKGSILRAAPQGTAPNARGTNMTTLTIDCESLHESFTQWQAEQQALDAQWIESLDALAAYQSHLDTWQNDLARQRQELQTNREQFERDRATAELGHDAQIAELTVQLGDARDKNAQLTQQLLARTDELRVLDQRRAELTTELEVARARGKESAAVVEELKHTLERERSAWKEELQHLRMLLEARAETATPFVAAAAVVPKGPSEPAPGQSAPPAHRLNQ